MALILWRNVEQQIVVEGESMGELIITVLETKKNRVKLSFDGQAPVWRREIYDRMQEPNGDDE